MQAGLRRGVTPVMGTVASMALVGCALLVDTEGLSGQAPLALDGGSDVTTPGDAAAQNDAMLPQDGGEGDAEAGCTRLHEDTFATGAGSRWTPLGDATLGTPAGWARLTTAGTFEKGAVWWREQTPLDSFDVSFAFVLEASGRDPADGFVFGWIDGVVPRLGGDSDLKGFVGAGRGYGVALDTYAGQPEEPPAPSIQVLTTADSKPLAGATISGAAMDGNEHVMRVRNRSGALDVWVDEVHYLEHTIAGYVAPNGMFGFTAATGPTTQIHRVSRVTISFPDAGSCPR